MKKRLFITLLFTLFLIYFIYYSNKKINEKFSPYIIECLELFDKKVEEKKKNILKDPENISKKCPEECSEQIELINITSKLNSIQNDINSLSKTSQDTNQTTKTILQDILRLEQEVKKEQEDMEKQVNQGVN